MSFFSNKDNVDKLQQELDGTLEPMEGDESQSEQTSQEAETETQSQKVKIGETEYEVEELQKLVDLGKLGKEAEEKYNTKIDRVWPDFNKVRQENERLQRQIDALTERSQTSTTQTVDPETQALKEAQEAAKKVGLVLTDDVRKIIQEERQTAELLGALESLEKEIDGKDGIRPKFDKVVVLQHMQETGIRNPMRAYKDMYEDEWLNWQLNQREKSRKQGYSTLEKAPADKKPNDVKIDKGNIRQLLGEMFF